MTKNNKDNTNLKKDIITGNNMNDNKLQLIIQESGLEKTKAQVMLDNFSDSFQIASDWEKKAKMIVVSSEKDTAEMQMARAGRLFLREKRIAIEKTRVQLKEQALREGKAIDGIANVLKALIIPIEEYLEKQERFVEIKRAEEMEKLRIEEEAKIERERLAREEAERKEQERIRLENIRLQKEAEVREAKMLKDQEESREKQRLLQEKADKEQKLAEAKLLAEIEANEKAQAEIRAKAEAERVKAERLARVEKEKQEKILAEERAKAEQARLEQSRIQKLLDEQIECPFCHGKFNK